MKKINATLWACCLAVALCAGTLMAQTSMVTAISYNKEKITAVHFTHNSRYVVFGTEKGNVIRSTLPQALDAAPIARHDKPITCITSSIDGSYIVSASEDQVLKVWEAANNSVSNLKATNTPSSNAFATLVTFSPDGKMFASTSSAGIRVWDIANKGVVKNFSYQGTQDMKFTPDSRQLVVCGSSFEVAKIYEIASGNEVGVLKPEGNLADKTSIPSLDISFDGRYAVTSAGKDKAIRIWNLMERKLLREQPMEDPAVAVRFTNDGQYVITSSEDKKVKVWRTSDLNLKLSLYEYKDGVQQIALTNDGKFYAGSNGTEQLNLFELAWLDLKPWKPADITPPAIAMISPRMTKERGMKDRAYTNQQRVRVQMKANDLSGVASVTINGKPATKSITGDKYESEETFFFQENAENKLTVAAVDSVGNKTEINLVVEVQKITGVGDANYHALFIAEQDYTDKEIVALDNPIADGKKLAQVLKDNYGFRDEFVYFLENPTRSQIQEKLDELQANLGKNDNLIIFYAGHGIWDEQMEQGFWLPVDATMANRSNWFPNSTLRDYIAGIKTKHTLLIADACFSGGMFKTRAVADASPAIQEMYNLQSRRGMTSGALKTVPDKSVFMEYLIRGLENNSEEFITAMELFNGFRNDVINNSPNRQVPQFGEIGSTGDQGGDFIFVAKRKK